MRLIIMSFLLLMLGNTPSSNAMGMSYDIIPNKHTKCANDFGNGLSFFFEQVGGYGETAEVEQVSQVLKINLSVFQDVDYNYEDDADIAKHWHNIDTFSALVDTFISRINAYPDYYTQVHHNPADRNKQINEEERLMRLTDSTARETQLAALRNQPFFYYPPDYGYLSQGRLLDDLQRLKSTLECYRKHGITKIRLTYM